MKQLYMIAFITCMCSNNPLNGMPRTKKGPVHTPPSLESAYDSWGRNVDRSLNAQEKQKLAGLILLHHKFIHKEGERLTTAIEQKRSAASRLSVVSGRSTKNRQHIHQTALEEHLELEYERLLYELEFPQEKRVKTAFEKMKKLPEKSSHLPDIYLRIYQLLDQHKYIHGDSWRVALPPHLH